MPLCVVRVWFRCFGHVVNSEGKIFNFFITIGSVLDLGANAEGYLLPKLASIAKFLLPPA